MGPGRASDCASRLEKITEMRGLVLVFALATLLGLAPPLGCVARRSRGMSEEGKRWNINRPLSNYFDYFEVAGLKDELAKDAPGTTILEIGCAHPSSPCSGVRRPVFVILAGRAGAETGVL